MTRSNSISILPLFVVLTAIFQQHVRAENGTVVDPVNVPDVVLQNNATTVNDTISILLPKLATADEADGIPATAENAEKEDDNDMIPGQYIVFYKKNADRTFATQQRRPFRIVLELRKAVAVAGISDEQYKELLQDPSVEKVIPVRRT